jgi:hypothetical protein
MQEPCGDEKAGWGWDKDDVLKLEQALARHGRNWVAVSRDVGNKTKHQCRKKVVFEVSKGRMQEPGGKRLLSWWSNAELLKLMQAVERHGRDWVAISRDVGSKTAQQCKGKVSTEVGAGRMVLPESKRHHGPRLLKTELLNDNQAELPVPRDWLPVPRDVGSKAKLQSKDNVSAAGRILEPLGELERESSWSKTELLNLKRAVDRHGRDWAAVARVVGSGKTKEQCKCRVSGEVDAGRMQEPGGKQVRESWSEAELIKLIQAVSRHGRDWIAVQRDVGSKTKMQCIHKVFTEVNAGRMQEPVGKRARDPWTKVELVKLKQAVGRHGRDWAAVERDVGTKTSMQCQHKLSDEVRAGRWPLAP